MLENRTACRRRVLKSAMIEFEGGAFSCAVRNLSDAGAAVDDRRGLGRQRDIPFFQSRPRPTGL
jgi:hypothetical protein